jgi:hypothetical protein
MSSPVSRVHPVACGESIGAGLYPASCFFLLFTGKNRESCMSSDGDVHRLRCLRNGAPAIVRK